MNQIVHAITGRLSLREPQYRSLAILERITEILPIGNSTSLDEALRIIGSEYPTVTDFERSFPSLCFALATGVGKTRLMGAFITYLYLAHDIRNFFVLAPNLTIYNKLIADFTPCMPKYVFKGIAEFAVTPPLIITGDNYDQLTASTLYDAIAECHINVFNISKINSEVRGGKAPRVKSMQEELGKSYFDYLAALPDLVVLMDESHRYRASAGVRAINELRPVLGLELTATPFVEGSKGAIPFKNVVYDYPLAQAIEDGFVKEPAVATKENFSTEGMTPLAIEDVKLKDGILLHESIRAELVAYAINSGSKLVKPFVLIIARDTTHAAALLTKIGEVDFFGGYYKDKVIQVDSSTKEDEVIERLLKVEETTEPTEIVIHVNMLKEGWDVTNLYTIIPLRAASARILIEQSIGRGLRLPYGRRTGVAVVDTLNIVSHDRFQEIIDEAMRGDSPLRMKQVILGGGSVIRKSVTVVSQPIIATMLGLGEGRDAADTNVSLHFTAQETPIAQEAYKIIQSLALQPNIVPGTALLQDKNVLQEIVNQVQAGIVPVQSDLGFDDGSSVDVAKVVAKTVELVRQQTIDIPQIQVVPKGSVSIGFKPFVLDTAALRFAAVSDTMLLQGLQSGSRQKIYLIDYNEGEERPQDIIIDALSGFNDIAYEEHAALLYDLAEEALAHLRGYLAEKEIMPVVRVNARTIADIIHGQMQAHATIDASEGYEVKVSRGYVPFRPSAYTTYVEEETLDYKTPPPQKADIRKYIYGGFKRCLYPLMKFDSDGERRLAKILEHESERWFRPSSGQFPIYYPKGNSYSQYEPDFVCEISDAILMLEVKALAEMTDDEVKAKANAAVRYCELATNYAADSIGKQWFYLMVPDEEIADNMTLTGLIKLYRIQGIS